MDKRKAWRGQSQRHRTEHRHAARLARSKAATTLVAATTAIKMPGTRGQRFSNSMRASVLAPIASAMWFVFPRSTLPKIPHAWRTGPFGVTENPKSLGPG